MSRLIVKNLPSGITEERFRNLFADFGTLTDCSLKFTKDGKFRKFGFIGFKSEEVARMALAHFNKSYIDTARVTVEFCKSFGDPLKPRAWSKHSPKLPTAKEPPGKSIKSSGDKDVKQLEEDEAFQDFLAVHQKRSQVATWSNDTTVEKLKKNESKSTDDYLNFDSDESDGLSEMEEEERAGGSPRGKERRSEGKAASKEDFLSDMDYLRSKVVKGSEISPSSSSSSSEESDEEEMDEEEPTERGKEEEEDKKENTPVPNETPSSGRTSHSGPDEKIKDQKTLPENKKPKAALQVKTLAIANEPTTSYTAKLRGAPFNVTEQNVREFLVPLRPAAIRIARNAHGNKTEKYLRLYPDEEKLF